MDFLQSKIKKLLTNSKCYRIDNKDIKRWGITGMDLHDYQLRGLEWMISAVNRGHGAILGDEMGLGKTVQSIALLAYININFEDPASHRHVIICPLSVLAHWGSELKRAIPGITVLTYYGSQDERRTIRHEWRELLRKNMESTGGKPVKNETLQILLTTYECATNDIDFFRRTDFFALIIDEGHRFKAMNSVKRNAIRDIPAKFKLILTGTPVQNNLNELYSLLAFVSPDVFPDDEQVCDEFAAHFANATENKELCAELRGLLSLFLLRRQKEGVFTGERALPDKCELLLYHGLTGLQKTLYKALLMKSLEFILKSEKGSQSSVLNTLMQLRKCVVHPYLFAGVEPEPFSEGEHLVRASGKLIVLDRLLDYLKRTGHRVLLFSQFTRVLDVVQDYLNLRGHNYERLDGSVRAEERNTAVRNFSSRSDDAPFAFLLSTRAGGLGLNLVAADTAVIIDSDFNPQNDIQAAARLHRIGQTKPVRIIRLVARDTVEEVILKRAQRKLELSTAVVDENDANILPAEKLSVESLTAIVQYGVGRLFKQDASTASAASSSSTSSAAAGGDAEQDVENVQGASGQEVLDMDTLIGPTRDGVWLKQQKRSEDTSASVESASSVDDAVGADTAKKDVLQQESDSIEPDEKDQLASPFIPADTKLKKNQLKKQEIYLFEGRDYTAFQHAVDLDVLRQWHKLAHASERGSADAQSGEEGDGLLQLRTRSRKRASRYGSGKDEWTGTSSAKHARPAASAKSDELEKRISTAIGFTHQFKFAGASPQITNQQQKNMDELVRAQKKLIKARSNSKDELSCLLEFAGEDVVEVSSGEEGENAVDLQYVEGDVTRPKSISSLSASIAKKPATRRRRSSTSENSSIEERESGAEALPKPAAPATPTPAGDGPAIIAHCVDASGRWGRGGLFDAIARRPGGSAVPAYYAQASQRRDLALGDAHLVPLEPRLAAYSESSSRCDRMPTDTRDPGCRQEAAASVPCSEYLCLLVAQREHSRALNPCALALALVALARAAHRLGASVHLPRIGERDDRAQWYVAERLIRKHLADCGVPAAIYYFKRALPNANAGVGPIAPFSASHSSTSPTDGGATIVNAVSECDSEPNDSLEPNDRADHSGSEN